MSGVRLVSNPGAGYDRARSCYCGRSSQVASSPLSFRPASPEATITLRYSNQFRVLCAEEETEADRLEAVSARVRSWLGGRRDLPLAAAEPGRPPQRLDDGEGTTVTERRWADDQAERLAWAWAHPDAYDHDLRWRTEVDLARWDDRVTFSLIIRTESHSRALRPESIRLDLNQASREPFAQQKT